MLIESTSPDREPSVFEQIILPTPPCLCMFPHETTEHFVLDCFLYSVERQNLFELVSQQLPNFQHFNKSKKLETLLYGISDTIKNRQFKIFILWAFQNFLLLTKRFKTPRLRNTHL